MNCCPQVGKTHPRAQHPNRCSICDDEGETPTPETKTMFSLKPPWLTQAFLVICAIALLVFILRGFAILTMVPGFMSGGLLIAAISLGVYLALVSLR
jgi:hypothetical protein